MTIRLLCLLACVAGSVAHAQSVSPGAGAVPGTGNAIFLHPDGTSLAHWDALRLLRHGPDGETNWDRLPVIGLYRGHLRDSLAGTSNGGGTVHAYGVKARASAVGGDEGAPLTSASGARVSVLREALDAGLAGGVVNTASVTDAGTAVFLATVARRDQHEDIAAQMLAARPHVLLGGGERWFVPAEVMGRHGPGARKDGRDLVAEARQAGYTVVFTRDELLALPADTRSVLGLFASADTFNGEDEATLRAAGQPTYLPGVPSYAEMIRAALDVLARAGTRFLLVAEEEGTDNYANVNHAAATLEALARADEGIGVALEFLKRAPDTLVLTAADSNAGGLQVLAATAAAWPHDRPAPPRDGNGAPIDGRDGEGSLPFLAAPDARGERMAFAVAWATRADAAGGIVARAAGLNSQLVAGSFDNTRVHHVIYRTLFGRDPGAAPRRQ
ncbi:MAG: alkaline phosphatase [Vicinamibacterales bacterium]|nr:alkaline phosphatase [Vicinamibacterales bacterium]